MLTRERESAVRRESRQPSTSGRERVRRAPVQLDEGERGLVVGQGLRRTTHPLGRVARLDGRVEGCGAVPRGERVTGQVGRRAEAGVVAECVDAGPVQLEPFGGEQVVGHGLGEQRVPELVAPVPPRLEDVVLDGGPQRRAEGGLVDPRDALECFGSAPVDLLAIGPFAVRRNA